MTRGYGSFTDAIETWLDAAPGEEDAESVLARIVAELDATPQRHSTWSDRLRMDSSAVMGFSLGAVATLIVGIVGLQLFGGTGVGGPASAPPSVTSASSAPPLVGLECPPYTPRGTAGTRHAVLTERGLVGLPPTGSSTSAPEVGRLVDCWPVNGGGLPYVGMVRLYEDGRLIWNYYFGDGNSRTTGHIEQRLTPEGVELLRGLDDIGEKDPLRLPEWLPSTAWEDRTIRPYVPARYGACLFLDDDHNTSPIATLDEKLAMLPHGVAVLLRGRAPVPARDAYDPESSCLSMTTAEARELDVALRATGFDQDEWRNRFLLEYHLDVDGDGPGTTTIAIWFEPVFPDGSIGCSSCG